MYKGYLMKYDSTIGKEEIMKFSVVSVEPDLLSIPASRIIIQASSTGGAKIQCYQSMFTSNSLLYSDSCKVQWTVTTTAISTAAPGTPHFLTISSISRPEVH